MKNFKLLLLLILFFPINLFTTDNNSCINSDPKNATKIIATPQYYGPQGWIFDLGGQFSMVDFTIPFVIDISAGAHTKITYQKPQSFYGQLRSTLNLGSGCCLFVGSRDYREWYGEYVTGYCFGIQSHWMLTPYGGIGVDALNEKWDCWWSVLSHRHYQTCYLLFGLEARYSLEKWYFALQADGLPIAQQYLTCSDSNNITFKLKPKLGAAVRLSAARRLGKHFWLELTPYYRCFPFGSTENQVGVFLTLRYAI